MAAQGFCFFYHVIFHQIDNQV